MYQTVIGLEIHAELKTKTKAFCSCENSFGKAPNTNVCPVCLGLPGALPTLSYETLITAAKACKALSCDINPYNTFDRKNYFYPDLPKSYQITQQTNPISKGGAVEIGDKLYRINNIHIEEDAGKLIHDGNKTYLDFNRAGVPLIEIVTEPDFGSAGEACAFVEEVIRRLKYADVCDARLEEGSIRVDVNISQKEHNSDTPGTRTELKNIGSLRSLRRAIGAEEERQRNILKNRGTVLCETRRYDERLDTTLAMRPKENANHYRYFAEPDMLPVMLTESEIENIQLPEMPQQRYERYVAEYGISEELAALICEDRAISDFYDSAAAGGGYAKCANLMCTQVFASLNELNKSIAETSFTPSDLSKIIGYLEDGKINNNSAKLLIDAAIKNDIDIDKYAAQHNLFITDNLDDIACAVENMILKNTELVDKYLNGDEKLFGYLMGQVMRGLGGSANPSLVKTELIKRLSKGEII